MHFYGQSELSVIYLNRRELNKSQFDIQNTPMKQPKMLNYFNLLRYMSLYLTVDALIFAFNRDFLVANARGFDFINSEMDSMSKPHTLKRKNLLSLSEKLGKSTLNDSMSPFVCLFASSVSRVFISADSPKSSTCFLIA